LVEVKGLRMRWELSRMVYSRGRSTVRSYSCLMTRATTAAIRIMPVAVG
jgi:hypothetical protein